MSDIRREQTAKPSKIPTILAQPGGPTSIDTEKHPSKKECEVMIKTLESYLLSAPKWTAKTENLVEKKILLIGQTTAVTMSCKPYGGIPAFPHNECIEAWIAELKRRDNEYRTNQTIPLDLTVFHRAPFLIPSQDSKEKKRKATTEAEPGSSKPIKRTKQKEEETSPDGSPNTRPATLAQRSRSTSSASKVEPADDNIVAPVPKNSPDKSDPILPEFKTQLAKLSRSESWSDLTTGLHKIHTSLIESKLTTTDERLSKLESLVSSVSDATTSVNTTLQHHSDRITSLERALSQTEVQQPASLTRLSEAEKKIQDLETTLAQLKRDHWNHHRELKELEARFTLRESAGRPEPPPPRPPELHIPPSVLGEIQAQFQQVSSSMAQLTQVQTELTRAVQVMARNQTAPAPPTGPRHGLQRRRGGNSYPRENNYRPGSPEVSRSRSPAR